jgi:hypothetical protein
MFCVQVEREIFESTITKHRDYKSRLYTLNFNISDKRNTSIRRRILTGEFSPQSLAMADSETLASDEIRLQRQEQRDKYFFTQVVKTDEAISPIPQSPKRHKPHHDTSMDTTNPIESTAVEVEGLAQSTHPLPNKSVLSQQMDSNRIETTSVSPPDPHISSIPPSMKSMSDGSAKQELKLYAQSISQRLERLRYESQRVVSQNLVNYMMRNV